LKIKNIFKILALFTKRILERKIFRKNLIEFLMTVLALSSPKAAMAVYVPKATIIDAVAPLQSAVLSLSKLDSKIANFVARHHFGFCKQITPERLLAFKDLVLGDISRLNTLASVDSEYVISPFSFTNYLFINKVSKNYRLYFIFKDLAWKGSYKQIRLGVEIGDEITPLGFSLLSHDPVNFNELTVRSNVMVGLISPKIYFSGMIKGTHFFCHEFAHYGSCGSFAKEAIGLKSRHYLAIEFLEHLKDLHEMGVHKDLHIGNLVVSKTAVGFSIKINDFGSFMYKNERSYPGLMTTASRNLSPEIMRKCFTLTGTHRWDKVFDAKLSFLDWELLERFHAGVILINILTGRSPFDMILKSLKPQYFQSLDSISTISDKINFLRPYLSEKELSDLWDMYYEAFHHFYWTLFESRDDLPYNKHNTQAYEDGYLGPFFKSCPFKIRFKNLDDFENLDLHEAYTDLFESFFNHEERIKPLESYLTADQKVKCEQILKSCDNRIKASYDVDDFYPDLLMTLDRPIIEFLDVFLSRFEAVIQAHMRPRLEIILPLLDFDPDRRPDLLSIATKLLALKDL
jgi:serine/threonine protein kinase